ncbi:MAG: hypothetical protein R3351_01210, partial [Nitrospirales bacterium]|nr:hypothetical protein [Nitrospirales bacterium]
MTSRSHFPHFDSVLQSIRSSLGKTATHPCLISTQPSSFPFILTLLGDLSKNNGPAPQFENRDFDSSLIITASEQEAEQLYQDLWFFRSLLGLPLDPLVRFPQWGTLPYQSSLPPIDVIAKRVTTLHRLTHGEPIHVVTSAPALIQKVLPQKVFAEACVSLKTSETHERTPLIQALLRLGYHRVSIVEIPGEFSIRGGILDIFSTAQSDPLRVEFLGDTIDSIRLFDPATQESIQKLKSAWILPAREYLPPTHDQESLHPLQQDAEWYSPNLYSDMESLVEYFHGVTPRVILHRPIEIRKAAGTLWNDILEVWTQHNTASSTLEKESYPEPDRLYLLWEDLFGKIQHWPILGGDSVAPPSTDGWHPIIPLPVQSASSFGIGLRGTPLSDTLAKIHQLRTQGPVFLIA